MNGKLAERVVRNNPKGVSLLLTRTYGMKPTRSMAMMVQQLNWVIINYKEDALRAIAEIHPDRELFGNSMIQTIDATATPAYQEKSSGCDGCDKLVEKQSGCAGCGGTCGGSSNASGCGCGGNSNASGCGCGGSSNASGKKLFSGGGLWNENQPENWVRYGSSNANGEGTNPASNTESKSPAPSENNVGKGITYLAVGVVAVIVAGIVFKSY